MPDHEGPAVLRHCPECDRLKAQNERLETEVLRLEKRLDEVDRVRTLVGCTQCGRGHRARDIVAGLCPPCAGEAWAADRLKAQRYATAIVRHLDGTAMARGRFPELDAIYDEVKGGAR